MNGEVSVINTPPYGCNIINLVVVKYAWIASIYSLLWGRARCVARMLYSYGKDCSDVTMYFYSRTNYLLKYHLLTVNFRVKKLMFLIRTNI